MRIHTHARTYAYIYAHAHMHTCKKERDMNTEVGLTRKENQQKGGGEDSIMGEISMIKIHYVHV